MFPSLKPNEQNHRLHRVHHGGSQHRLAAHDRLHPVRHQRRPDAARHSLTRQVGPASLAHHRLLLLDDLAVHLRYANCPFHTPHLPSPLFFKIGHVSAAANTSPLTTGALQQYYGEPNDPNLGQSKDITWVVVDNRPVSSAIVACSYLFVATFATTWGPTSWTYPAEIFPSKIRAKAVSLATSSNWFWNMVLAFAVPPLLWNISYKMVWFA